MNRPYPAQELFAVRNHIPIRLLIESILRIPSKMVEGIFRFLCPLCSEFQTAVHTKTNLARCFLCRKNFNTIDLVIIAKELNFVESVKFLQKHLASFSPQISYAPPPNSGSLVPLDISSKTRNITSPAAAPPPSIQPQPAAAKPQISHIPCPSVRTSSKQLVPIGEIIRQPDFLSPDSQIPPPSHPGRPGDRSTPSPVLSPDHLALRISQIEQNMNSLAQLLQRVEAALDRQK